MTKVGVIADSKNEFGQRITSIVVTFPRILLAEVNTHRMFSRNSASSRAIRFQQMVKNCQESPFIPFRFQKDHPGMQGTEYFDGADASACKDMWLDARDEAIRRAYKLNQFGVTKQLANRILEPFQYHTALITATEWENFVNLRVSPFAEDHFQDLAKKVLNGLNESEPKQLKAGEWHIPFGDKLPEAGDFLFKQGNTTPVGLTFEEAVQLLKVKIATVRCARISYNTQDKETSIEEDLKLHDRLASSGHWSAFEHCARAMSNDDWFKFLREEPDPINKEAVNTSNGWCGNFRGFIQYRKMFPDENRTDSRLIKK